MEDGMLTREDNEILCRVEGDAPMGQLMRRHWAPLCLSEEVAEPDGAPVRARMFGEDLVVFRDTDGRVGVLDEYCPHRRVSLALGRNEECGLRCLYHGWKMDVEGNVVEMASEPAESTLSQKVKHKAYPAREGGGFVWTYMGPPEEMPEFEPPPFAPTPETNVSILKVHVNANWAQVMEGQIDSAHSSSLHSSDMVPARVDGAKATDKTWLRPSTDRAPRYQSERTDFGFRYVAIRRPIQNAGTHDYLRVTVYVAPFIALIPPNNIHNVTTVLGPTDDHNTAFYFIAWNGSDKPGVDLATWRQFNRTLPGVDLNADFTNKRTRDNNYQQNRDAMKLGDFTGIKGIPNQDIAMWETMGSIVDRSKERLGASDFAVVEFRQMMVEAAKRVRDGGPALGTRERRTPFVAISSYEGIVSKTTNWRTLSVAGEDRTAKDQVA
jgi:phthalate 4,5-dioxygenase oxygenase subunit